MLQLNYSVCCFLTHVLDCVLIPEPVGSLNRVVHVPAPIVFTHIAQRRTNAALRSNCVTSGWEYFGDTCRLETLLGKAECCAQPRTTSADDYDVIIVVNEVVLTHAPKPMS